MLSTLKLVAAFGIACLLGPLLAFAIVYLVMFLSVRARRRKLIKQGKIVELYPEWYNKPPKDAA